MKRLILILLLCGLSACAGTAYYSHLASGQSQLLSGREPIKELLSSSATDPQLRQRLQLVNAIRDFASSELSLPDNDSYRYYVDLGRPHAVWNVYAAEEFSVVAKEWCFPIAGCVGYRGYFELEKAETFAQQLDAQGLDSFVGGVAAYSTLGWFDDPVLNTFVYRSDSRLAGLIFHELAHQQVYLAGDTAFNESFARAVEIEGVYRWLTEQGRSELMAAYLRDQAMHTDFVATLLAGREQLAMLYQEDLDDAVMRQRKQALLEKIQQQDYPAFRQRWQGDHQYDGWVARDFNNAKLATLANYHQWLPAFQQLLRDNRGDFSGFFQDVQALANIERWRREQYLAALGKRASAQPASATLVSNAPRLYRQK